MDGGELLLGVPEVTGEGGRGLVRASEMNSQAPLTAAAGSVPSSQPSRPASRADGEPAADLGQQLGQPGRCEGQLAEQLVGVGGLGQAAAAEGGVVQGADCPGRGAGQGQRLRGESVTALSFLSFSCCGG